jgi:hypothetical protein
MPEAKIAQAVQLLDLMLEHFADDDHWTRGRYDDGKGGHCLVGALLHLSRKHRLPRAPAIALLQDAMPRPGLPLVQFNDTCCAGVTELRSIILKARRLAEDHAEQDRAAGEVKAWLLAQIAKNDPHRRRMSQIRRRTSRSPSNASPPSDRRHSPRSEVHDEIRDRPRSPQSPTALIRLTQHQIVVGRASFSGRTALSIAPAIPAAPAVFPARPFSA